MESATLYRKYRPLNFSSVVGQNHITTTLKNQIISGKIPHAYLFTGTRGTGKTTCAKLMARAINCLNTTDGEPCGECRMCVQILKGNSVNVTEMDAASNNKVEDTRLIKEEVKYPPSEGVYKVYIIDEVHMLTGSAFNALLKTLEEPPSYVIFILATTDPQKLPATILSRCQRYDFRRITNTVIEETLNQYIKNENRSMDIDAIRYIANLGDGSMRDSLSVLGQCLSVHSEENITYEMVAELLGAVDPEIMFSLSYALGNKDSMGIMDIIADIMEKGRDLGQFINEYIMHLRNYLIYNTTLVSIAKKYKYYNNESRVINISEENKEKILEEVENKTKIIDVSKENKIKFYELNENLSSEETIFLIEEFSKLNMKLKNTSNIRILLEVELLRLCSPWVREDMTAIMAKMAQFERELKNKKFTSVVVDSSSSNNSSNNNTNNLINNQQNNNDSREIKPVRKIEPLNKDKKYLQDNWEKLKNKVTSVLLRKSLKDVSINFKNDNRVYLVCETGTLIDIVNREKNKNDVKEVLQNALIKNNKDEYKEGFEPIIEIEVLLQNDFDRWYENYYYNIGTNTNITSTSDTNNIPKSVSIESKSQNINKETEENNHHIENVVNNLDDEKKSKLIEEDKKIDVIKDRKIEDKIKNQKSNDDLEFDSIFSNFSEEDEMYNSNIPLDYDEETF